MFTIDFRTIGTRTYSGAVILLALVSGSSVMTNKVWAQFGGRCVQGAPEICNGIDDNCNGVVDEGCHGYAQPPIAVPVQPPVAVPVYPPIAQPVQPPIAVPVQPYPGNPGYPGYPPIAQPVQPPVVVVPPAQPYPGNPGYPGYPGNPGNPGYGNQCRFGRCEFFVNRWFQGQRLENVAQLLNNGGYGQGWLFNRRVRAITIVGRSQHGYGQVTVRSAGQNLNTDVYGMYSGFHRTDFAAFGMYRTTLGQIELFTRGNILIERITVELERGFGF